MKKISLIVCLVICTMHYAFAQTKVKGAEYFWDTDPGEGLGHAVSIATASDSVHVKVNISTAGILPGFHNLYVRTIDDKAKWSLPEQRNVYISQAAASSTAKITAAEYFWDTDPGEGHAHHITVGTASDSVNLAASIVTTGISPGFHALYVRVKDNNNLWSLSELRQVYIYQNFNPVSPKITAAEYFWDTDPGEGQAHHIAVGTASDSVSLAASIATTGISQGFHSLYVRVKDNNNLWSLSELRQVYIYQNFNPVSPKITTVEYFWDTDPGIGKGHAVTVSPHRDSVSINTAITVNIAAGFHQLYFRSRDENNLWSLVDQRNIYVSSYVAAKDSIINAAEYFIDVDPGAGKAAKITITHPADSVNQAFNIKIPANTDTGYHLVYVRTRTSHGVWGISESAVIHVGKNALPIGLLYFRAVMNDGLADINWETTTEINSSQFEVQRSVNGTSFATVATILAAGNSSVPIYYNSVDKQPPYGTVYYRLKETDRDGNITYSMVVKLDNNTSALAKLYPNPAKYAVHIDIPAAMQAKLIILYNMAGQAIQQREVEETASGVDMNVSALAAGKYQILIISKNGDRHTLNFTK